MPTQALMTPKCLRWVSTSKVSFLVSFYFNCCVFLERLRPALHGICSMVDFDSNVRRINGRKQPHIFLEAVSYLQRGPLSSNDNADKI